MNIRISNLGDATQIVELFINTYGQKRYKKEYAFDWVKCIINNPTIMPSCVAVGNEESVLGYIAWKVRKLDNNDQLILEIIECAAGNSPNKLEVEKELFNVSPRIIIGLLNSNGHKVNNSCYLDVWVHKADQEVNKSVLVGLDKSYGRFLGCFENKDARGEMMKLYRQEYKD